jgi:membrane-associated protease RseP (regulator of RpoE activity)
MFWFLFVLFASGWLTYVVIARQVKGMTRTPIWQLWAVLMSPILVMTFWRILNGGKMLHPIIFLAMLIGSFFAYVSLIQRGRIIGGSPTRDPKSIVFAPIADQPITSPPIDPAAISAAPPPQPMTDAEAERLKECFPWSVYFVQNFEYRPQAVICWGQLRGKAEDAYAQVQANVQREFGDRFLLVLQEAQNRKPVFAVVTNPQVTPEGQLIQKTLDRPGWGIVLAILSFCTTTWAGYEMSRLLPAAIKPESPTWVNGLPYALAWMGFFGVRELGYYFTARHYGIPVTLPYFIPLPPFSPQLPIGTLGAFIQLRSPVPNRRVLFDIRAIGSVLGFLVAIGLLAWGLTQSTVVPVPPKPGIFDFEGLKPQFSLLLACLSKWALGSALTADTAIGLHPIAFAGWLGVLFSVFNLMPIGSLDGGRIVHAVYGQRVGGVIGNVTRWVMLLLAVAQQHLLLWAFLLFLLPTMDEPALNDVTELDSVRDSIGLLVLALLVLVILPPPPFLLHWLGLG